MVILSLPSCVEDFEGRISHSVVVGASETLVFVAPQLRDKRKGEIDTRLRSLNSSLVAIKSSVDVKLGEAYIGRVNDILARVLVISKLSETAFQVYLMDEGMKSEVAYDELFEFPSLMAEFSVFDCVCPFFMSFTDKPNVFDEFVGCRCRCTVVDIDHSNIVVGYVKGRLLVEVDGTFVDMRSVLDARTDDQKRSHTDSVSGSPQDSVFEKDNSLSSQNEGSAPTSISDISHCAVRAAGMVSRDVSKKNTPRAQHGSMRTFVNRELHENTAANEHYSKMGALFRQTAFKEFSPGHMPTKLRVRFEKKDRSVKTFWVVNPRTFSAIEKALRDNESIFGEYPYMRGDEDANVLRSIPCIVYTRADSSHTTFFRAVAAHYDKKTRRFSIFLVDFGWFKWVLAKDVIDISSMDKTNPLRDLPVALIHCREDNSSPLRAEELVKGNDYMMTVKSSGAAKIFSVLIDNINALSVERSPFPLDEEDAKKELEGSADGDPLDVCRKIVNETCHQQLMNSLVMESLTVARRELAMQQQQTFWSPFYGNSAATAAMPVMMPPVALPLAMPIFLPMPSGLNVSGVNNVVSSPDSASDGNALNGNSQWGTQRESSHFVSHQNTATFSSPFNGSSWQENRDQSTNRRHLRDYTFPSDRRRFFGDGDGGGRHGRSGNNERSSFAFGNANSDVPLWATLGKRRGGRRGEGRDIASPVNRMTAWERAVAEDRANRKLAAGDADAKVDTD
uniref:Tudor domain-containing protein n=6 Tax=Parascaris univalens TaxID=6257 RepID=A0A915B6Q6_PARUN